MRRDTAHVSGQGADILQHTMERSLCHQEPTGATEKGCWSLRTITELSVLDCFLRFVGFHVNDLSKESDPNYTIANGNSDPGRGFGHICISVDNIQAACKRIEDAGYPFQKKLTDGRMRQIAFAKDPDGYWVEIIGQRPLEETEGVNTTETSSYRFNHSMIRVKSAVSGHTRIAQRSLSLNTHLSRSFTRPKAG